MKFYGGESPFEFCVIDNFLSPEDFDQVATAVEYGLPDISEWHRYDNPLEKKLAFNDWSRFPDVVKGMFDLFDRTTVAQAFVSGKQLSPDPHLNGAGIHRIQRGGYLLPHLDHSRNRNLPGFERKLNFIFFVHPFWTDDWGGHLKLYSSVGEGKTGRPTVAVEEILPLPNRLVIFEASDRSWHGHPDPLNCPPEKARFSLATYYYAAPPEGEERYKVQFGMPSGMWRSPDLEELIRKRADPDGAKEVWEV